MKERPILFSTAMVRAILDGSKTQTRRIIKPQPDEDGLARWIEGPSYKPSHWYDTSSRHYPCPYGQPGDRLWVRETWVKNENTGSAKFGQIEYKADYIGTHAIELITWKPSIHMPRKTSRITLEITKVRVERLHDISEEDAIAEGIEPDVTQKGFYLNYAKSGYRYVTPIASYKSLWELINGEGSWKKNPWVWVIEFKQIKL